MIALRLHDKRDLRLHEEPVPTPGDDEVLVRVTAVGLCGSDLHWFREGAIGDVVLTRPLVLGHEFVGVIETGARTGERVALDPAIACGACAPCLAGHENLCVACGFAGNSIDGALRSRLAWPERLAHRVPDSLPDVEAALLEPLGVALHALDLGHVRPGATAGVYGCGPLGLLLVQLLLRAGVNVLVATDPLPHRAAAAEALGATVAVETRRAGMEILPQAASGGVDVAFEVAGEDDAIATAIDDAATGWPARARGHSGGRPLVLHGLGRTPQGTHDLTLPADEAERPATRDRPRRERSNRAGLTRQRAVLTGRRI